MKFEDIDQETQELLIEWFNVAEPDDADRQLLADLWNNQQIRFWDCPRCKERLVEANPDDWGKFQGTGVGWADAGSGSLCSACTFDYEELKRYADQ